MSQTTEKANKSVCKASESLISLITSYDKEQVDASFTNMDKLFKEWNLTDFADDKKSRQQFAFSLQILQEFGEIVKALSPKKIKAFYLAFTKENNQ